MVHKRWTWVKYKNQWERFGQISCEEINSEVNKNSLTKKVTIKLREKIILAISHKIQYAGLFTVSYYLCHSVFNWLAITPFWKLEKNLNKMIWGS